MGKKKLRRELWWRLPRRKKSQKEVSKFAKKIATVERMWENQPRRSAQQMARDRKAAMVARKANVKRLRSMK